METNQDSRQGNGNGLRVPEVDFSRHQLENGLEVFLCRDQRVPLVHLTLHYRVGSSYEAQGRSGLAHLFEHMMFQGSANVGKNEHGRYVSAVGGRYNAMTGKDRTSYFETLPSNCLELGLWLESDRMRSLKVTPENLQNQLQTVIEEKKQSYDNRPYGLASLRFDELAYTNWAYAHPIIGSVEDLEVLGIEDALAFHGTYYHPGNATLVLSGDFEEEEALGKIDRYFSPIENGQAPPRPETGEPIQESLRYEVMADPLAHLPAAYLGFHIPEVGSPDHYALSLLSMILAYGESSRLYRKLVYDKNWVAGISSGPNLYKGAQLLLIWFQAQEGAPAPDIIRSIEEELERLQTDRVRDWELEKARNQVLLRLVDSRSTVSSVGEALARYVIFYERPDLINRDAERYLRVDAEDIRSAARRAFPRRNTTVLQIEPSRGDA